MLVAVLLLALSFVASSLTVFFLSIRCFYPEVFLLIIGNLETVTKNISDAMKTSRFHRIIRTSYSVAL